MICIDLSRLYFAIRDLNVTINYEKLLTVLKEKTNSETVEAFTKADPKNVNQSKFLKRLEDLGYNLHVYDVTTQADAFTAEISAMAALSEDKEITILSNDQALLGVFRLLEERGRSMTLCFFSEKLEKQWTPKVLCGDIKFIDLSNPDIRKDITNK